MGRGWCLRCGNVRPLAAEEQNSESLLSRCEVYTVASISSHKLGCSGLWGHAEVVASQESLCTTYQGPKAVNKDMSARIREKTRMDPIYPQGSFRNPSNPP